MVGRECGVIGGKISDFRVLIKENIGANVAEVKKFY